MPRKKKIKPAEDMSKKVKKEPKNGLVEGAPKSEPLVGEINSLKGELSSLNGDMGTLKEENEALRNTLEWAEKEKVRMEKELSQKSSLNKILKHDNNSAKQRIKRLEGENKSISRLKAEKKSLVADVERLNKKAKEGSVGPIDVLKASKFPGYIKSRDDIPHRFDSDHIGRA